MMGALPFDATTEFRWEIGGAAIAARAVGAFTGPAGWRAVLMDTADSYWLASVSGDGRLMEIAAGPVTAEQAVHAAECICAGIHDHGSVSALVNILALGLVVVQPPSAAVVRS
ncbi:MAG: hypothetical protein LDL39_12800 [Magnetospirillum sp.]|nr:hypothetical protein [Magnetospirillum sp.]